MSFAFFVANNTMEKHRPDVIGDDCIIRYSSFLFPLAVETSRLTAFFGSPLYDFFNYCPFHDTNTFEYLFLRGLFLLLQANFDKSRQVNEQLSAKTGSVQYPPFPRDDSRS